MHVQTSRHSLLQKHNNIQKLCISVTGNWFSLTNINGEKWRFHKPSVMDYFQKETGRCSKRRKKTNKCFEKCKENITRLKCLSSK